MHDTQRIQRGAAETPTARHAGRIEQPARRVERRGAVSNGEDVTGDSQMQPGGTLIRPPRLRPCTLYPVANPPGPQGL